MFCKNCGAQLDDDAKFCERCGTVIKRIVSESAAQNMNVSDLTESETTESAENVQNNRMHEQPKKKSQKKMIVGAVAAVFVLVIGLLLSGVLGNVSNGNASNIYHEANFNNGAQFAYDNNRLYIVGLYNEDDEETVLYSTDYKGVNRKIISDDPDISSIRLVDGKIYYKTSGDDEYTIGVMKTDGSERTTIITSSESIGRYDVYKDTLYYLQDSAIHSCTTGGENDAVIIESAETFTLCNGYFYYVDEDDVISSYRIKNGETKEICKASGACRLSVDGNTLYFVCDTGLSSVMIDGDGKITKIVRDDELTNHVFYDGQIYYNHQFTKEEREAIVEYLADSSSDELSYTLALIGAGTLYAADVSGGDGTSVDSDQIFVYSLYSYPNGMYCQVTVWSDTVEPIELD